MGTEAFWVPAVIAALGTGAQAYTARQTAKSQDQAAARGIRNQQAKQRQIDERINESVGALEKSSPDDERAASLDQYLQQLRSAKGQMNGSAVPVGGSRYSKDVETSQAAIGNYGDRVANILSRIRGAQDQRLNEGYDINRMGSDTAGTARDAAGQAFLDQLRLNGIRTNPWVMAAGDVLHGVAGGMATTTANKPAPPMGVPPTGQPTGVWAGRIPDPSRRVA